MANEQPALPVGDPHLFFVCRMCTRMAEQIEQGAEHCKLDCGGPRKGKAYPLYAGPLTPSWVESHCVLCGDAAQRRIEVHGQGSVGICLKHIGNLLPPEVEIPEETETVIITTRRRRVGLYEILGIDPVNELGFEHEELDPIDQGETSAGDLHSESE